MKTKISQGVFRLMILAMFFILLAIVVSEFGFSLQLISIFDVYDVRSEYKIDAAGAGKLIAYSVPYLGVISSFMLGYGYIYRFTPFIMLGAISLFYIFGFTGQKSTLFSITLVLGIIFIYRKSISSIGIRLINYSAVATILAFAIDSFAQQAVLTSIFTRRVLITPGLLTIYYFDFFSKNDPVLLSHSFLSSLSNYPYDLRPPFLIGRDYFNSSSMSANANFLADGYSNFRYFGMLLFSIVLGFILRFIETYSNISERKVVILCGIALPVFALTNSALFTSILTHGLAFGIIITFIYATSQQKN
ncbi:hypothetical protein [Deinococcus knuensis]|uniref:hypothetical protein n=1 Tax=Deinococcus knuensis TaxID=1837380 RepID=UPI00166A4953|nr:hypothetical protein [Deinococcus knuensis]